MASDAVPLRGSLVVVAPHPDDEALTAAGAMLAAVARGEPVDVLILTNGDFDCAHDGLEREAESVRGLAALGVTEEHVHFLGYPDGYLARLGVTPLPTVRRRAGGACEPGNGTYGQRGAGHADVHTVLHGQPGSYQAATLVDDLRRLFAALAPANVIVTHPQDTHPDHAAAYAFVREALASAAAPPHLWRALVHNGDCWPTGWQPGSECPAGKLSPTDPTPELTGRLAGARDLVRVPVPPSCLAPAREDNPKLTAIFAHHSQMHGDPRSYMVSFARRDELFFPEELVRNTATPAQWTAPWEAIATMGSSLTRAHPVTQPLTPRQPVSFLVDPPDGASASRGARELVFSATSTTQAGAKNDGERVGNGAGARYRLSIDDHGGYLRLRKELPLQTPLMLEEWPLPHDWLQSPDNASLSILLARGKGNPSPLIFTVRAGGFLRGQVVDPQPDLPGSSVSAVIEPAIDSIDLVSANKNASARLPVPARLPAPARPPARAQ